MATITNKFIHFKTLEAFNLAKADGLISSSSIVYVKDAKLIWTHDTEYYCDVNASHVSSALLAIHALSFLGTLGTGGTVSTLPADHTKGWTYIAIEGAPNINGLAVEAGDLIICLNTGTVVTDSDWAVILKNIDGAVTGPTTSTNLNVAVFDGTSGTVIKDSGFLLGISVPADAVFTDNSVVDPDHHYNPADHSAQSYTPTTGNDLNFGNNVITGITKDSKGHIKEVTVGKLPSNPDTTYTFTDGTDGSFTVLASNSETPLKVSIGKPSSAGYADVAGKSNLLGDSTIGSEYQPVYLNNGAPTVCSNILKKADTSEDYLAVDNNGISITGISALADRVSSIENSIEWWEEP